MKNIEQIGNHRIISALKATFNEIYNNRICAAKQKPTKNAKNKMVFAGGKRCAIWFGIKLLVGI